MLRVRSLSVRFRRHDGSHATALSGLELTLARGEVIGLVGGSGAGKSLVAEALMGLLPRNAEVSGQITLDGQGLAPGQLALAPQAIDALDPLTRLGDQICRFARLAGQPPPDLPAALARLGLPATAARAFPHELSGGMAKRALIATALATGAGFLIADEPTLGLDPETADRILALLAGLAAQGQGVCVISHDLPRLIAIAGRVTILQEGRMVETALAQDFTGGQLRHPFSRALWAAQSWAEADPPC